MEQELERAQAFVSSKNYESAFNILHSLGRIKIALYNFQFFKGILNLQFFFVL